MHEIESEEVMTQKHVFGIGQRKLSAFLAVIVGLFLCIFSISAFADGSAPNLAYVTGTPSGVSAIDVRQRKVTTTLNVPGGPHLIGLSQDGRTIFVTEPQEGRVAVLLAQTGQTVCTASVAGHPTLLTFDLNTNLLYVAANDVAQVTALDPVTCQE